LPHATVRLSDLTLRHAPRMPSEAQRYAPLASVYRERPLPSAAGPYSPPAPSPQSSGDYPSVTMSAGTHVREMTTATVRRARVDTDSTEWMNHMSQRRVTEIPDRFSK